MIDGLPIDELELLEILKGFLDFLHDGPFVHGLDHLNLWLADGLEKFFLFVQNLANLLHFVIPSGESYLKRPDFGFGEALLPPHCEHTFGLFYLLLDLLDVCYEPLRALIAKLLHYMSKNVLMISSNYLIYMGNDLLATF